MYLEDKTGRARYRSFMQFDADIIGNVNEAQADAEICNIIADTFLIVDLKRNNL